MSEASTIERALIGAGYTEDVRVASMGGAVVRVRVLSPTELTSIAASLTSLANMDRSGTLEATHERWRVLHAACSSADGAPTFADSAHVGRMPAGVVAELWRAYWLSHQRTYAIDQSMYVEMKARAANESTSVERLRASHAAGIVAFFGLPKALDATTAQVLWFELLTRPTT